MYKVNKGEEVTINMAKSRVKKAKSDKILPRVASVKSTAGRNFERNFWRKMNGEVGQYQGLQVWAPLDPYLGQ